MPLPGSPGGEECDYGATTDQASVVPDSKPSTKMASGSTPSQVTASIFAIFMALSIFGRIIYKAAEGEEPESEE